MIEYARNVLCLTEAHSTEFNENSAHPVIVFMPEVSRTHMGGTMRLGSRRTLLTVRDDFERTHFFLVGMPGSRTFESILPAEEY